MFPGFLYPYTVKHVKVTTPGYTNQTTGEWVPEVATEISITPIIMDISLKDIQNEDQGTIAIGDRKLIIEKTAGVQPGHRVKIYEDQPGTDITEWTVASKLYSPASCIKSLKLDFETFLLKRRQ